MVQLQCDSKPPLTKMTTRHGTYAGRDVCTDSPSLTSSRAKAMRTNVHCGYHVPPVSLLPRSSGRFPRKGSHKNTRKTRAISEQEATRLDWMRRLRPKPHRRY
ncbi:hypothetical protein N7494_005292 [Penicillium frequentans]|uniref:Uncharacterized protein n=1 Tax=Penicillium frequentans TaxID=3151616 RepID=A0AAD6CXX3_9EURO|nr:hypothetical protein N7494_005292 [Penicillium glabrum]